MKNFNNISSNEEQNSQATGWEDVADYAPEDIKKESPDYLAKFAEHYQSQKESTGEFHEDKMLNLNSSMNRGETAKDRLARYRAGVEKIADYQKKQDGYKEAYKELSEEVERMSPEIERREKMVNFANRSVFSKVFDRIRFGFNDSAIAEKYGLDPNDAATALDNRRGVVIGEDGKGVIRKLSKKEQLDRQVNGLKDLRESKMDDLNRFKDYADENQDNYSRRVNYQKSMNFYADVRNNKADAATSRSIAYHKGKKKLNKNK